MHAYKCVRVEQFFQALHRTPQHISFALGMHAHVIASGVHPVYRFHIHAVGLPPILNRESLRKRGCFTIRPGQRVVQRDFLTGDLAQQFQQSRAVLARIFFCKRISHPLHRLPEAIIVDRLQQVVQSIGVKRLHGKFVECGNEDDGGHIAAG